MLQIFSTIKKSERQKGITLVETVFFIVLLSFMVALIVQMLFSIGRIYRDIRITRDLETSGTIAMERILREIRAASSVSTGNSVFGSNPGVLKISGISDSLNSYDVSFGVNSGRLNVSYNGGPSSSLTSSGSQVTYLVFTYLSNQNSEGVRVEMELSESIGVTTRTEKFYGFSVLRGSY